MPLLILNLDVQPPHNIPVARLNINNAFTHEDLIALRGRI